MTYILTHLRPVHFLEKGIVYCTLFRWSRALLTKKKSDAAERVDVVFHKDAVPTKMIMDGPKEQTLDWLRKKC